MFKGPCDKVYNINIVRNGYDIIDFSDTYIHSNHCTHYYSITNNYNRNNILREEKRNDIISPIYWPQLVASQGATLNPMHINYRLQNVAIF